MAEPFAGGAGASLTMLFAEDTAEIHINDADQAIHDFWWAVTERNRKFRSLVEKAKLNMQEWRRQRDTYRNRSRVGRLRRGFSAFYLNRCNRSGIIMNGGPIGGVHQSGIWKLDARFNRRELIRRLEILSNFKERIHCTGLDGLDFIETLDPRRTFFFIDPPYYAKGKTLYLNALDDDYHSALGARLKNMTEASWVLTYDDCPEVRRIYRSWANIRPFSLDYAASERRKGSEILITPKWMRVPTSQASSAIRW